MNANEISPRRNPRLNRIQRASAIFRTFFFTTALLSGLGGISLIVSGLLYQPHPAARMDMILYGARSLVLAVGLWFGYRLSQFYAAGELFSSRIVGCLKKIGGIAVLIGIIGNSALAIHLVNLHPMPLSLAAIFVLQLFFSVIPGLVIFCVAWIMDEGRKIQEEQELTV